MDDAPKVGEGVRHNAGNEDCLLKLYLYLIRGRLQPTADCYKLKVGLDHKVLFIDLYTRIDLIHCPPYCDGFQPRSSVIDVYVDHL
ncbi:hypothetical protein HAX54_031319, partial [Datura stramonium]|nr:hypothetical protein [Datura stramonium]